MAIATGTAIALGLTAAAPQIVGAITGSRAANRAADQQAAAAQQALDLQRQMYETTRGDLAPYRQAGGQGLTALTAFLGLPQAPAQAAAPAPRAPAGPTQAPPITGGPLSNINGTLEGLSAPGGPFEGSIPFPGGRAEFERLRATGMTGPEIYQQELARRQAAGMPAGSTGRVGQPGVQLRAPNGQTQVVPADQVDYYLARGARRV